jgi:hypothetical protein
MRTAIAVASTLPRMTDAEAADHSEPVIVATFVDAGEAEVAQAKLRAFGIESVIVDHAEGGVLPAIEAEPGVGIEVRAADAADAAQILEAPAEG